MRENWFQVAFNLLIKQESPQVICTDEETRIIFRVIQEFVNDNKTTYVATAAYPILLKYLF